MSRNIQICGTLFPQLQYNTFECNTLLSHLSQNRWVEKELKELSVFSQKMIVFLICIQLEVNWLRFMFSFKLSLKMTKIKWLILSEVHSIGQKGVSLNHFKDAHQKNPNQYSLTGTLKFLIFLFCSFFELKTA